MLLRRLLLLCLLTLALVARLVPGPRTIDDAYITFRYAQNVLAGNGLVYNAGQRVLGTTTPAYALLLTLVGAVSGGAHAPFPILAWLLNAAADLGSCWLLIRLGERLGSRSAGIAASVAWAISPMAVTFSIGGMETSVFVLLTLATLYLHSTRRPVAASLAAAVTLLTRPDGLILLIPLAIDRIRRILPTGRLNLQPQPIRLRELAALLLPLSAWIFFGWIYFGSPVPQSISAKIAAYRLPPEAALVRLLQHYATPFFEEHTFGAPAIAVGLILYPTLFTLGALKALRRDLTNWAILVFPWSYFVAYSLANPLIFRWYLAPPLPVYFCGIFLGIDRLSRDVKLPLLLAAAVLVSASLGFHAWTIHPDHGPDRPAPEMAYIKLELLYQEVAFEVRPRIQSDQVLAAGDIGALGYYTGARILDTVGLISPEANRYYPLPASYYAINYAIPPRLIVEQRPEFLVLLEAYGRLGLLRDPEFLRTYRLEEVLPTDIYGSDGMLVFMRKDTIPP